MNEGSQGGSDLGRAIGETRQGAAGAAVNLVVFGVVALLGVGVTVLGVGSIATGRAHRPSTWLLLGGGLALLALGAWLGRMVSRYWPCSIVFFEHGLTHERGRRATTLRYDDIAGLWTTSVRQFVNGIDTGVRHSIRLRATDGREIRLMPTLKGADWVVGELARQVTPRAIERALEALGSGGTADFGPISISRQGLALAKGQRLAWDEVEPITVDAGVVVLRRQGRRLAWKRLLVSEIPNCDAFVRLAEAGREGQLPA